MNAERVLRQAFTEHEVLAPDPAAVLAGARLQADRLRHRRRRAGVALAAGALVIAMAASITVARLRQVELPAAPRPAGPLVVLDLVDNSGYDVRLHGADTDVDAGESMWIRASGAQSRRKPGLFDPKVDIEIHRLNQVKDIESFTGHGTPLQVAGHRARLLAGYVLMSGGFVPSCCPSPGTAATLGWPAQDGGWIFLTADGGSVTASRQWLVQAAGQIRETPARPITVPYRLSYLPRPLSARGGLLMARRTTDPLETTAAFYPPGQRTALAPATIRIETAPRGIRMGHKGRQLRIGSVTAWYGPGPAASTVGIDEDLTSYSLGGTDMVLAFEVGNCAVQLITKQSQQFPLTELERIVRNATFTDCQNRAGWLPLR